MITKMTVEGFEVLSGVFDFKKKNHLQGMNGQGKSAVGDAILWAYTGRDIAGSQSTEHLITNGVGRMSVKLEHDSGTILERIQTRTAKTLKVNGATVTQEQFEKMLPVPYDVFASAFIVGYFDKKTEMEKRDIFMRITKPVDRDVIFAEMVGVHPSKVEIDWSQPIKKIHAAWNTKRKAEEKAVATQEGVIKHIEESISSLIKVEKVHVPPLREELRKIEISVKDFDEKMAKRREYLFAKSQAEKHDEQAAKINKQNEENAAKRIELEAKIQTVDNKELQASVDHNESEIKKIDDQINLEVDKRNQLQKSLSLIVDPGVMKEGQQCQTCGAKITKKRADEMEESLSNARLERKDIQDKIDAINLEIEEWKAKKTEFDEKIKADKKMMRSNEDAVAANNKEIQKQLADIRDMAVPTKPVVPEEVVIEENEETVFLGPNLIAARTKVQQAEQTNIEADQYEKTLQKLEKDKAAAEKLLKSLKKSLETAEKIEEALHPVRGIESKVLEKKMEDVTGMIKGVEFVLRDYLKNGDPYDCFKIKVDGVDFAYMSDGQKIKVGTEIAGLIDNLSGNKVKMRFIDNMELADSFKEPTVQQLFTTQVTMDKLTLNGVEVKKIDDSDSQDTINHAE